ncbi:uncharacterized protein LOC132046845 [Lycium ferocissimum]|uniref:uncharacterized protein LOC132046845 n=1 Tax=Lycium ferocissimum TaxID=112874 RepID=UPI002815FCA3|nr:uncharacterized protein LOC132046845 [Lycium ferocissimum]XP_059293601.1 uncharacterized protein LOC132046845 [Lycium ferocissimum]XP_059293602.1 uncharacterized protein LOC132046845 [Lycium ferocissimum]XP_059293604.1 uncharacterized protein LOC132046845 [Lycium ferocissimum]XP_059293605.1 uncharacterized protein LOC132046845 [Lycium ferocissimum]XP_059293606.1 uncharacterized protein LOC132046845 [Lycium ferocissimum]XP_059293607.1 uncharacterized protein LOC132046845 [Lycium ferocissimu
MQRGTCNSYLPTGNYVNGGSLGRPDLRNTNAPLLLIMHDPTFSVPWQQFPLNWTYSSIYFQVPFMYPVNETIGYEVIPHQHSLPFVPTYQFPHASQTIGYEVISHQRSLPFVPTYQFPHVSQTCHASIIPRNPFSYWTPAGFLTNTLAPVLPTMHASSFTVSWPQFLWNWTYSSIYLQAPFMYPVNETIVYEVIPHQHSLLFVPTYQFPHISLVPGAERIVTRENMVNTNFAVQQANFPMNHPPRFAGVNHGPGLSPLHPYNSHMAQNAIPPALYGDVDNMTYEGLLALQAHIGHVSRGLSEQVIVARMKCIKYESTERLVNDIDTCCICLEDFSDGQLIGSVDCRHSFHFDCIRRWLMEDKNICPLCNGIALTI